MKQNVKIEDLNTKQPQGIKGGFVRVISKPSPK
jgi:hypothetical protein